MRAIDGYHPTKPYVIVAQAISNDQAEAIRQSVANHKNPDITTLIAHETKAVVTHLAPNQWEDGAAVALQYAADTLAPRS
jgi:hypothetical protein